MHRSDRSPLFSHPNEPSEVGAPAVGVVRTPVFSDLVVATPSAVTDEAGPVESGGD
ncbi:hypothetical protein [Nocardia sputorum]|uniref:hypothetical protein n=1 Tax=Nocardia sputorum TaxID=2984338 RepID=UPI0024921986|nr:hypothetical protein [Nocardia sputorum]